MNKYVIKLFCTIMVFLLIFTISFPTINYAITEVENVSDFDVEKYGKIIEVNPIFPNKTNVEFVQILDRSKIKMRVWERGTGETLACGTGACATAVACIINDLVDRHVYIELLRRDFRNRMEQTR